jgi:hypothetical protein
VAIVRIQAALYEKAETMYGNDELVMLQSLGSAYKNMNITLSKLLEVLNSVTQNNKQL